MGDDSFKITITALVLFVAFTWLILSFTINMGGQYGKEEEDVGGESLNVSEFYDSAEGVGNDAENYRSRFEQGKVDDVDDASGVFSVLTDMINLITKPFGLLAQLLSNLIGVPKFVINIFLGLLGIGLILGIWRVVRMGS